MIIIYFKIAILELWDILQSAITLNVLLFRLVFSGHGSHFLASSYVLHCLIAWPDITCERMVETELINM